MIIYLDANIVQYFADHEDFILGDISNLPTINRGLLKELVALRTLIEIEQFGEGWIVAAPTHLMRELFAGEPTQNQRKIYGILLQAWQDFLQEEFTKLGEEKISSIEFSLRSLNLEHSADRRHLAESIAVEASWFLTNDKNVIKRTREGQNGGKVQGVLVVRPSEFIEGISKGLFLRV